MVGSIISGSGINKINIFENCGYLVDENGKSTAYVLSGGTKYYQTGVGNWNADFAASVDDLSQTRPLTAEQLKLKETYIGFDFENVWEMGKDGYPTLQFLADFGIIK